MSYILDALKKAEAERNTAHVPGPAIAQPLFPQSRTPVFTRRSLWPWLALAVLAGALIGAVWLRPSTAPVNSPAPAPQIAQPAKVPTAPTAAPAAVEQQVVEPTVAPEETTKAKSARKAVAKKAPVAESIATLSDLPESIQRQIPALKVGGYIYSANKADRSVLINDRLLREGDEAAPGLVIEQMQPDGMVLSYKGYRYRRRY